jgi:hypothetical protein
MLFLVQSEFGPSTADYIEIYIILIALKISV